MKKKILFALLWLFLGTQPVPCWAIVEGIRTEQAQQPAPPVKSPPDNAKRYKVYLALAAILGVLGALFFIFGYSSFIALIISAGLVILSLIFWFLLAFL